MRLQSIQNAIIFLLLLIVAALVYTQIVRGAYYRDQSINNRIRVVPIDGPRGRILDRNGLVLADNRPAFHVGVVAQDVVDSDALFNYLGRVLKKDPAALARQYKLRRLTPFAPVILAEDVPKDIVVKIQEDRLLYPGLVVEEGFERFYPFEKDGAHVLGYVGKINPDEVRDGLEYGYTPLSIVGKSGVEKMYDNVLYGTSGGRQIEINNRGQEVRLLGLKDSEQGKDIKLTLDERLQQAAQELLGDRQGSVVVMDTSSGEVLTLVSSPSFDPNAFSDHGRRELIGGYLKDSRGPLINRAVSGQYPPGSVFKIIVALAAIQLNRITPETSFDCPGYYMLGQRKFGCAHVHGVQDLTQALAHSCNVYFFHVGKIVTPEIIGAYAKAFGFGRSTGIDLPYEVKGKIVTPPKAKGWFTGNTLNLSIGQGDTLSTPMQITVMMAAVANNGLMLKPRIAKVLDQTEVPAPDLNRLPMIRLRDEAWRDVQKGLRSVVTDEEGTGHELSALSGMTIWGKTGTAQAGTNKPNHAWFAGYAQSPKNNIAFCVFLEHGGSSANAVAITKELLTRMQALNII